MFGYTKRRNIRIYDTMYANKLKKLKNVLRKEFRIDVVGVLLAEENENDGSAKYTLDGIGAAMGQYYIEVDMYEGKHTTIKMKTSDGKDCANYEGSSFTSTLDMMKESKIAEAKKLLRENGFYVFKKEKKLNEARVKVLDRKVGESLGIDDYPNFHKSGSVRGMKDRYYGKDALLVRCGDYIYNVSNNPEIYELAESTKLNENHRDEDWGILIDFLVDIDAQYKYDREEKNAINIYGTNGWHSVCYNEKNRIFFDIHDIFATDDPNDSIKEFKDPYDLIDYIREYA